MGAAQASAHVSVRADSTESGSFSALTFRVPNESDTAGTVKIAVDLPQDTPLLYVSTKPVSGWTATAVEAPLAKPVESYGTTITKAVRTVTWTAVKGTQIAPGEYQEFAISAGPLPEVAELRLPTTQTYSDGKVVRWDQPTPASGEEPEYPAPTVAIEAAGAAEGKPVPVQPVDQPPIVDGVARGLAAGALALAAAGLVVAVPAAGDAAGAPRDPRRLRSVPLGPCALAVVAGAALALYAGAAPAGAHNALTSSAPVSAATESIAPAAVVLTFDQPVIASGTRVVVTGPDGPVQTGQPRLVDNTVTQPLEPAAPAGNYTVTWRVTSVDGHPVSGTFGYTAAQPGTAASPRRTSCPLPPPTSAAAVWASSWRRCW